MRHILAFFSLNCGYTIEETLSHSTEELSLLSAGIIDLKKGKIAQKVTKKSLKDSMMKGDLPVVIKKAK